MTLALTWPDWLALFGHFLSLSLFAVGGAIMLAPDMHRYLVDQRGWLTDPQFASSIALAQASPGPNVLFIACLDGMSDKTPAAPGGPHWAWSWPWWVCCCPVRC
jgi:chromate transport protein ChrA